MARGEQIIELLASCDPNCTVAELAQKYPCLRCLSENELLAVLLYSLAQLVSKTVDETLECSRCLNCMSKKDKLVALVAITAEQALGAGFSIDDLKAQVKCLECASQNQLQSGILSLICEFWDGYTPA